MNKDTLIVPLSDFHSGGTTALFPDRFIEFASGAVGAPKSKQQAIYKHFEHCAKEVLKARKDKRLIIVHNGDAIDGVHHASSQIVTYDKREQSDLHVELMNIFKKWVNFHQGDLLYYTKGTESHTDNNENHIGKELGAVQTNDNFYVFDDLTLTVNDKRIWFTHHGPNSGRGPNKGNAFRNWLRDRFYECVNEDRIPPNMIITGHTHDPFWQIYIGRYKGNYFPLRGMISPSWQLKTRYANGKIPLDLNKIGLQYFTVTKEGFISDPEELIMV